MSIFSKPTKREQYEKLARKVAKNAKKQAINQPLSAIPAIYVGFKVLEFGWDAAGYAVSKSNDMLGVSRKCQKAWDAARVNYYTLKDQICEILNTDPHA